MNNNITKKDWGMEIIWADEEQYCAKILLFEKTLTKTPFVFHNKVNKTFFVNAGEFKFRWIDTSNGQMYEKILQEGSVHTVQNLTPWSLESQLEGSSVMQVSNINDSNDTYIVLGG